MIHRDDEFASEGLSDLVAAYRGHYGGIKQKIITDGVRKLSEMFTGQRPHVPGYLARHNLRQAYVCYYLPINHAKIRRVLRELKRFAKLPERPRVLDFGSGPGTASLAVIDELPRPEVTLVDIVSEGLADAKILLDLHPKKAAKVRCEPEIPGGRFDLVVASNVLAELRDPAPLERILERHLEPEGHFVLVEPALSTTTRRVMEWRDKLHAAGWKIAAPCLGVDRCPMRDRADLWCHQESPWKSPSGVDQIDRQLGFDKEALKYSYLVVTKTGRTRADTEGADWRVVSNVHRAKGRVWTTICGRSGPLVEAELLTRHRSEKTADFEHARRGDVLSIQPPPQGRFAPETEIAGR